MSTLQPQYKIMEKNAAVYIISASQKQRGKFFVGSFQGYSEFDTALYALLFTA